MIFFDFDGTLVDIWQRYYQVFCVAGGGSAPSYGAYVAAKRRLVRDDLVAAALGVSLPPTYYEEKRRLLEEAEYLALDALLLPSSVLTEFFGAFPCRILTARREPATFYAQLSGLGLASLAEKSVVLRPQDQITKKDFLAAQGQGEKIVVGDAEAEYEAAVCSNTQVFLVRTGLRTPKDFTPRKNVHLLDSAAQFISQYRSNHKCPSSKT